MIGRKVPREVGKPFYIELSCVSTSVRPFILQYQHSPLSGLPRNVMYGVAYTRVICRREILTDDRVLLMGLFRSCHRATTRRTSRTSPVSHDGSGI